MSCDYVVRWAKRKPTKKHILCILQDFFGGGCEQIRWDKDRWQVYLPGHSHNAFERVSPLALTFAHPSRALEVWPDPCRKFLYIMTRQADQYTNALAQALCELFARFYQATIDPS